MTNHVQWDVGYATGDAALDDRYRQLLALCNALADHLPQDGGNEYGPEFQQRFEAVIDSVRHLYVAEQERLEGCPLLDEHNDEIDEFEYLVADIVTEENFDPIEVQRFLALWCVGHIAGFGSKFRDFLAK